MVEVNPLDKLNDRIDVETLVDLRRQLDAGIRVPIVQWRGLKVHDVKHLDLDGEALLDCGLRISTDLVVLVRSARRLKRPLLCLNCHRAERRSP